MELEILIADLQKARVGALAAFETAQAQVETAQAQLARIDNALASLQGQQVQVAAAPPRNDFADMGPTAAAEKLLLEKGPGAAMTTNEITAELVARGLTTMAANPSANVYASLANRKDRFIRKDKKWMLKVKKN